MLLLFISIQDDYGKLSKIQTDESVEKFSIRESFLAEIIEESRNSLKNLEEGSFLKFQVEEMIETSTNR